MKTLITAIDNIVNNKNNNLFILCGEAKPSLEALFYNLMNNYCKQGAKCLCVKDNNINPIDFFIRIKNNFDDKNKLEIINYNLTTISISRKEHNINKFISIIENSNYQVVFIKLTKKLITNNLIITLKDYCLKFGLVVFLMPQIELNKTTNNDLFTFNNWADYVIYLQKEKINSLKISAKITYYKPDCKSEITNNNLNITLNYIEKFFELQKYGSYIN